MAFFKKLKRNVGIEEKPKKKKGEPSRKEASENKKEKPAPPPPPEKPKKKHSSDWLQSKGQLAVDVYETDDNFCVHSAIAGVDQANIDIFIEGEMLIIKGERKAPGNGQEKKFFYKECYWGPFSRQIILPEDVEARKIKASLKKGILVISMPRRKTEKKKVLVEIED